MRAFTLDSFDTPPALREDLPTPAVAEDHLLVRVQASSVNPVDAFIAAGALKGMADHQFPSSWVATRWPPTTPWASVPMPPCWSSGPPAGWAASPCSWPPTPAPE
jgi:NADPH:quinone reductase-like Zn-dependent oxidoreductase